MDSATRAQADSSVSAGRVGIDLLEQIKAYIEAAVQNLDLKMKWKLDLVTEEQIVLRKEG